VLSAWFVLLCPGLINTLPPLTAAFIFLPQFSSGAYVMGQIPSLFEALFANYSGARVIVTLREKEELAGS
jgi:hypothetical protein